jgi:hypothetical protein
MKGLCAVCTVHTCVSLYHISEHIAAMKHNSQEMSTLENPQATSPIQKWQTQRNDARE